MSEELQCEKCGNVYPEAAFKKRGRIVTPLWCASCQLSYPEEFHPAPFENQQLLQCERCELSYPKKAFTWNGQLLHILWCPVCRKEHSAEYKLLVRRRIKKNWRDSNPESVKYSQRMWKAKNPQKDFSPKPEKVKISISKGAERDRTAKQYYSKRIREERLAESVRLQEEQKQLWQRQAEKYPTTAVSLTQAANQLGISRQALHQHYIAGHITGERKGGIIFVSPRTAWLELEGHSRKLQVGK